MAHNLPYIAVPSVIKKILNKIKDAKTPERFTQDFLETKLGCKGGNARQFIPFAKKVGLLNSDGTPTELYKQFRNEATAKAAIGTATKKGFRELFDRNEYANDLTKDKLKGLVVEITGLDSNNRVIDLICNTFEIMKAFSSFTDTPIESEKQEQTDDGLQDEHKEKGSQRNDVGLNLSYSINLVLPKTDDPAVFNAIFKSLRENLLRK